MLLCIHMLVYNESKICKIAQNFQIPSKPIEIFKYGLVRVVVNGDGRTQVSP